MCGICGIAMARGAVDSDQLAAMSATLVHRGPDSDGAFVDASVGLAARRLAIIDLATGDQPIVNENGRIAVVQNGEVDLDALEAFLAFNSVPGPLTIFRDVRKLQPGHVLTWENGRSELIRYARPAPVPASDVRDAEEAELVEELRARMRDSVRAHLVSDVPVGVLLSGGVDSSLLAAFAAGETSEPLRTFSIGFEERSFDE